MVRDLNVLSPSTAQNENHVLQKFEIPLKIDDFGNLQKAVTFVSAWFQVTINQIQCSCFFEAHQAQSSSWSSSMFDLLSKCKLIKFTDNIQSHSFRLTKLNLSVQSLSSKLTKLNVQVGQAQCWASFFEAQNSSWSSSIFKLASSNVRSRSSRLTKLKVQAGQVQ